MPSDKNPLANISPEQLQAAIKSMSPAKLAELQKIAAKTGLVDNSGYAKLPDGSVRLTIVLPPDVAGPILTIAEASGSSEEEMIRQAVMEGAIGWPYQSYGPETPPPVATATVPNGTTAIAK